MGFTFVGMPFLLQPDYVKALYRAKPQGKKKDAPGEVSLTVSHLVNKRFHVAQVIFERTASGDS